ncbi:DUF4185 domain-containing protein [Coraliomargarita akajimensis]|nr:DUF4185 domain-containing protein [Coraliomargarita akajimensis]
MKNTIRLMVLALTSVASAEVTITTVPLPNPSPGFVWRSPSPIPEDCPFEQSPMANRIYFTGKFSNYWVGDTFYPSWASDGNLYSPFTDGSVEGVISRSYKQANGKEATTGHAVMRGDDPLKLDIRNTSAPKEGLPYPYSGRYPAGSLVHDGIWYYGTYCLGPRGGYFVNDFTFNWPNLGPMPGFQISYDLGQTWEDSPHTPASPLFPEPKLAYGAVKMGAPHFVDFGKNMEHSPDGKAYLIAMGAEDDDPMPRPSITKGEQGTSYKVIDGGHASKLVSDYEMGPMVEHFANANLSWISADQIYLARVTPSPETINDEAAYEYFAGHDTDGHPVWTDDFDQIQPLIEWNNNMGCVTATYVPHLKKYLMCVTDGWPTVAKMDSYILEADHLTGPWRMVTYMKDFGEQAYFLNFPTKFIKEDGTLWLCYSANFSPGWNGVKLDFKPYGGRYGLCLHEMRFLAEDEQDPIEPANQSVDIVSGNIAPQARISVSSLQHEWVKNAPSKLADGIVDGEPRHMQTEWASNREQAGAWARFEWEDAQTIDRIILADRPIEREQVLSAVLRFSDGSEILVDQALPNDATEGLEISFAAKTVHWVKFEVLKTKASGTHIGLSEVAIFTAKSQ